MGSVTKHPLRDCNASISALLFSWPCAWAVLACRRSAVRSKKTERYRKHANHLRPHVTITRFRSLETSVLYQSPRTPGMPLVMLVPKASRHGHARDTPRVGAMHDLATPRLSAHLNQGALIRGRFANTGDSDIRLTQRANGRVRRAGIDGDQEAARRLRIIE